jgi:hypothetical protein
MGQTLVGDPRIGRLRKVVSVTGHFLEVPNLTNRYLRNGVAVGPDLREVIHSVSELD